MRKYIIEQTDTAQLLGSYIAETEEDDDDGRWDDATGLVIGVIPEHLGGHMPDDPEFLQIFVDRLNLMLEDAGLPVTAIPDDLGAWGQWDGHRLDDIPAFRACWASGITYALDLWGKK